jgi:hypothetical protein
MAPVLPIIDRIPTFTKSLVENLNASMKSAAAKLLADSKKIGDQKPEDKSIMGLLRQFVLLPCFYMIWLITYARLLVQYKDQTGVESQSTSEEVLGHVSKSLFIKYHY